MNVCNVNKEESNIEAIGQDIHLGHNISVTKTAYEEIQRVKEPSKFVTNLAYAVWGYKTLCSRAVRQQSNCARKVLTPKKKEIIYNQFAKWLTTRGYSQNLISEQLEHVNTYLGRAISGAMKHEGMIASVKKNLPMALTETSNIKMLECDRTSAEDSDID